MTLFTSLRVGLVRWLEPLFALLEEETQAAAPGARTIFAKLADVFVTQPCAATWPPPMASRRWPRPTRASRGSS